jgi:hypothetical protein
MNSDRPPPPTDVSLDDATLEQRLDQIWRTSSGFWAALATGDHKVIARRYIITAFIF